MPSDLRTHAIVLRRTNYGESDRILSLLTPEGKIAVLARGVRKEKSRLAGGIELFSVADVVMHQGHSNLATLTSAKMLKFYGNIMTDLPRLELASHYLKRLDRLAEQTDNPEFFTILKQILHGLHQQMPLELVRTWAILNLARATGEEINLVRDVNEVELSVDQKYLWDGLEQALRPDMNGQIGVNEIKFARILLTKPLSFALKVEHYADLLPPLGLLVKSFE